MSAIPKELGDWPLELKAQGYELSYTFNSSDGRADIPGLLHRVSDLGLRFKDLHTQQSSLEDIFVSLLKEGA